ELYLEWSPACVLVRLLRTRAWRGRDTDYAHTKPFSTHSYGAIEKTTICYEQIPLISVYACTDYRAQGQTLPYVIIDIGKPPTGGIGPFNAHVALSPSQSMEQC
ncbi:hypothetical protein RSAG8_13833, partial [Rhizoctonia solani AG-8 WAC10335]